MTVQTLRAIALTLTAAGTLWLASDAALAQGRRLPPAEDKKLETKDGVVLTATYFPGAKQRAVPVMLLHGYKGSRADFRTLAPALQAAGHAVLVPDLRGHGASKTMKNGDQIDVETMPAVHFERMGYDLERCKQFLREENNAEHVNIDKLCIVAADMSTVLAVNWSATDWSFPPLAGVKQGQDVKALVLLSPQFSFKTINCNRALEHPAIERGIAMYFLVGKSDREARRECSRVYKRIEPARRRVPKDDKNLFLGEVGTKLQGTRLLQLQNLGINDRIAEFFDRHVTQKSYPWKERPDPITGQ